jgi:hypothetical protein
MTTVNALGYLQPLVDDTKVVSVTTLAGIQAAIDALPATGGTVQLVSAIYTISAPIVVNKPNVAIKGVDERASQIVATHDGIAFDFQALAVEFELTDVTIIGPDRALTNSKAIMINEGASGHVADLTVKGFAKCVHNNGGSLATEIADVDYKPLTGASPAECGSFLVSERLAAPSTAVAIHVSRCTVTGCKLDAFVVKHSRPRTHIESCTVDNQTAATFCVKVGDSVAWCDDVKVAECNFAGAAAVTAEVRIAPSAAQTFTNIAVDKCSFQMAAAVNHVSCDCANIDGRVSIHENSMGGSTGSCIAISNIVKPSINDNVIKNLTSNALGGNTMSSGTISGNQIVVSTASRAIETQNMTRMVFSGNRIENTGTGGAFFLQTGSSRNTVSGNCIAATTGQGIEVTGTSSSDNVFSGNNVTTTSGICFSTTVARNTVTGNNFAQEASTSNPVLLITTSDITVAGNRLDAAGTSVGINLAGADRATISGNHVIVVGAVALAIDAASQNVAVSGNVLRTGIANAASIAVGGTAVSFGNQLSGAWTGDTAAIVGGPNVYANGDLVAV